MNSGDREIEIKLKLEDNTRLQAWLEENAEKVAEISQHDIYFDPPDRSFRIEVDGEMDAQEFLRVRFSDRDAICYKHWYRDDAGKSTHADEFETELEDGRKVLKVFDALGFEETARITKDREVWRYREFEFALDSVEELGEFVEIEYQGDAQDPTVGLGKIYQLLDKIGLKDWKKTKRGYCFMIWNPDAEQYEI